MRQQWYYQKQGQTHGPVSRGELQQLFESGQLDDQSQVIRDGMKDWIRASQIDTLDEVVPPPAVPKGSGSSSSETTPPASVSPSYERPPTRQSRRTSRLPLYFGSLVVVAVLVAIVGWIAHSLSAPDSSKQSQRTAKAGAQGNTSGSSKPQAVSRQSESEAEQSTTALLADTQESPELHVTTNANSESASLSPNNNGTNPIDDSASGQPEPAGNPTSTFPRTSLPPQQDAAATTQVDSQPEKPLVLFQELDVQRQPKLSMLGTVMAQDIHYRILSELNVGQADEKGFRQVQQVVKDTQLVKADALSQTMFAESLKRLIGWQFAYTLNFRNEVIEIHGPDDGKRTAPVEPAGAKGFLVTSVMDEDGWKELAELSFFAPDPQGMKDQSWTRQMTHSYEPLGSWFGETTFTPRGKEQDTMRIDYSHKLTYAPPEKAAAAAGGLPFTINSADFKAETAGGTIYFDTRLNRVQSAQEQFHVRGTLSADALGQVLDIPVEEQQAITVLIVDQNPWDNQAD